MSSIFLSYSSADVADAIRVQELLEARGYVVFRDKDAGEGIPAGTKWASELFLNLDRVDIVVFLASATSLKSPWCHTELAVAVARGKYLVQIGITHQKRHPVLADREAIGPAAVEPLADLLVSNLARVGFPPGDSFEWDPNRSPYPGLTRFDEDHAAVLFGRDREIAAVMDALGRPSAAPVLVVGPSGTGKSSLIRAGVVPRLQHQSGTMVLPVVEPGADPLQRLGAAIRRLDPASDGDPARLAASIDHVVAGGARRVVLVLDQAEDLLSRASAQDASELVRLLRTVDRDRLAIVVIVRSASLDPWIRHPALGPMTPADPIWVRPLDRNGMREVVLGPARLAGIKFDPESLVETILDDAGEGLALPLLAALMEELTEGHSRVAPTVITTERYQTVGPVARVIERRAQAAVEDVRTELKRSEASVVDAYLRLAEVDEHAQLVRDELPVDELTSDVRSIFDVLERHRLVTRDRDGREVLLAVHEEVFRAWPALKAALEARTVDLQTRTWLRRDAEAWAESGRGEVPLTGGRLGVAKDWAKRNPSEVSPTVHDYLGTARRQERTGRLFLVAAAAVPVLLLGLAVVGAFAYQAIQARQAADTLRLVGDARANLDTRRDLALLLGVAAQARSDDAEAQAMPLVALTRGPGPSAFQRLPAAPVLAALAGDGRRAVIGTERDVRFQEVGTDAAAGIIPARPAALAISGDGSTVAIAFAGRTGIDVYQWPSTAPSRTCPTHGAARIIRLSDRGDLMVVVTVEPTGEEQRVVTIDPTDCTVTPFTDITSGVSDIAIAGDSVAFALGMQDVQLWNLGQDLVTFPFSTQSEDVRAIAFDTDQHLAGLTAGGRLLRWDTTSDLTEPRNAPVLEGAVGVGLRWRSDKTWLVADESGAIRVVGLDPDFDLGPILRSAPEEEYRGPVTPLAVASTDDSAVTVDMRGRIVTWDLVGRPPLGESLGVTTPVSSVDALPDGSLVAVGGDGIVVRQGPAGPLVERWKPDGAEGGDVTALSSAGEMWAFGTSLGDVFTATGSETSPSKVGLDRSGRIQAVQPLASGGIAVARAGPDSPTAPEPRSLTIVAGGATSQVAFDSPIRALATTGPWLFVGLKDGSIHVVDTRDTPREVGNVRLHKGDIGSMAVSPDGRFLMSGSDDRHVFAWAIDEHGALTFQRDLAGHTDRVTSLAFSPDGAWLASGSEDRHVILWQDGSEKPFGDPIGLTATPTVAFDPTGDRQLYVAADELAHWDMRDAAWVAAACRLADRDLTEKESARYLGVEKETDPCATGS
jgi:WD40 repeat protein